MTAEVCEIMQIYNDVVHGSLRPASDACVVNLDPEMIAALIGAASARLHWLRTKAWADVDNHSLLAQQARREAVQLEDAILALEVAQL